MGNFYNPQPPSQGPVNSTLPVPHDPIPAQGDQPPRRQVAFALMMAMAVAAWPADLEPRLQAPNNTQQKIAPLTLTYGTPPRPQPFLTTTELHQLVASWPPDAPLPPRGQQRSWMPTVVTFTPSQPLGQLTQLVSAWPLDLEPRLGRPNDQLQKIAPLTLPVGQQPPRFSIAARMAQVVQAWPPDLEPRLGRPNEQQQKIAPLTLTYGTPPRPQPFLTTTELHQLVASWPPDAPLPPRGQQRSWMPTVVAFVPGAPSGSIYPAILQANRDEYEVELISVFVQAPENPDPPPRTSALSRPATAIIAQAWQPDPVLPFRLSAIAAAVAVPPIVVRVPYAPAPGLLWQAWVEPFVRPPAPVKIAPLTLPSGAQPQPQPPLSVIELAQIVATWVQTWDAQTAPKNAAWNVPPVLISLPFRPPPRTIWTAWEPPWIQPSTPVAIAPLTLTYGQQPPRRPPLVVPLYATIVSAWPADLEPRLGRPNAERVRIAPLTLTYGTPPPTRGPLLVVYHGLLNAAGQPLPPLPMRPRYRVPPTLVVLVPTYIDPDKLRSMSRVPGRRLIVDHVNKGIHANGVLYPVGSAGSFVPVDVSGGGLVLTGLVLWTLVALDQLQIHAEIHYPVTADGSNARFGGLPFLPHATQLSSLVCGFHQLANPVMGLSRPGLDAIALLDASTSVVLLNSQLSNTVLYLSGVIQLPV